MEAALDRMELLLQKDPTYPEKTKLRGTMQLLAEQNGLSERAESIEKRNSGEKLER